VNLIEVNPIQTKGFCGETIKKINHKETERTKKKP
jgi:hypothetical protein